jgi:hypothetical protein
MKYNGKLYGKWRGKFLELEQTADDYHNAMNDIEKLEIVVKRYEKALEQIADGDIEPDEIATKALNVRVKIINK